MTEKHLECHAPSRAGVMIGLPGQTTWDLANDLKFFKDMNADMIGEEADGSRDLPMLL